MRPEPQCSIHPGLAVGPALPRDQSGADFHRAARHSLVRARLHRRHRRRLVLCARHHRVEQAVGRAGAVHGDRLRRFHYLDHARASSSAAASATCCSTIFRTFAAHPLEIFELWNGGMSFHGGFLGCVVAIVAVRAAPRHPDAVARRRDQRGGPIGLFLGRIANFINGELWGRPTDVPWAMIFPNGGPIAAPSEPALRGGAGRPRAVRSCSACWCASARSSGPGSSPAPSRSAMASRASSANSSASPTRSSAFSGAG